jgi:hypothetical protein
LKKSIPISFWSKADTLRLGRMLVVGLAVGIIGRYVYITAPPTPVMAAGPTVSASTNAPAPVKNEGVSPSARD